jgi:hypothetical protein
MRRLSHIWPRASAPKKARGGDFFLAFREHWFAAMSGGVSVPFAIWSALADSTWAHLTLAACALTCAWFAAFRVWKLERERVLNLEERLSPKIDVSLDPICNGIRVVQTAINNDALSRGPDSKWVQFLVKSMTEAPLVDCEARILTVERLKTDGSTELILDEPMFLQWSNVGAGQNTKMSIPSGVTQPCNMFSISQNQTIIKPETAPYMKPRMTREIQKPGKYKFNVVVSAINTFKPVTFLLEWGGSYDQIRLTME